MNWNNNVAHNLGPSQQSFSTAASLCKVILGLIIIIIWKWHFGGNWKSNSFVGGRFVRFDTTIFVGCDSTNTGYYFTPSAQIRNKKTKQSSLMMKNASPNIKGSSWQYYWHDKDFSHRVVVVCGERVFFCDNAVAGYHHLRQKKYTYLCLTYT